MADRYLQYIPFLCIVEFQIILGISIFKILLLKSLMHVHNIAASTAENYIMHKYYFFLSFL